MVAKFLIGLLTCIILIAVGWFNISSLLFKNKNPLYHLCLSVCLTGFTFLLIRSFDLYLIAHYKFSIPAILLFTGISVGFNHYKNRKWLVKIFNGILTITALACLLFYGLTTLLKIATQ